MGDSEIGFTGKRRAEQQRVLAQGGSGRGLPRKRFYRARAHSNPLSDSHFPVPLHPGACDWTTHFPTFFNTSKESTPYHVSDDNQAPDSKTASEKNLLESASTQADATDSKTDNEKNLLESASTQADAPDSKLDSEKNLLEFASTQAAGPGSKTDSEKDVLEKSSILADGRDAKIRFADIGCGFGGLLVQLAVIFPDKLMLGMELRDKVSEYVKERIISLRAKHLGKYENISVLRSNAMKYLPNYFEKGQLEKLFFLFPDPHFKEKNHRRRIISPALLAEYAYVLGVGGIVYTITDVQELGEWMKSCLDAHPLFEALSDDELASDPVVGLLSSATEEGQKVARNEGDTYRAIYKRIASCADA